MWSCTLTVSLLPSHVSYSGHLQIIDIFIAPVLSSRTNGHDWVPDKYFSYCSSNPLATGKKIKERVQIGTAWLPESFLTSCHWHGWRHSSSHLQDQRSHSGDERNDPIMGRTYFSFLGQSLTVEWFFQGFSKGVVVLPGQRHSQASGRSRRRSCSGTPRCSRPLCTRCGCPEGEPGGVIEESMQVSVNVSGCCTLYSDICHYVIVSQGCR